MYLQANISACSVRGELLYMSPNYRICIEKSYINKDVEGFIKCMFILGSVTLCL
jgi:hypothetical protein